MPREFKRNERVAGSLRRELAQLIQGEVKDPAVGFVALSDVEVTRDLSLARVYITVFDSENAKDSIKALNRAAGFLRKRLGQIMTMRQIPELRFLHDASVETGLKVDDLIARAIASDRRDASVGNDLTDDFEDDIADDSPADEGREDDQDGKGGKG